MESKLYKWNKRKSKMIINTDYKTFNKQVVCVGKGSVISNCQFSSSIRPFNEIECYGNIKDKGVYRNYDLSMFQSLNNEVKNYIENITENKGCTLYEFRTFNKNKEKNIFGYIVEQNNEYKIFNISYYSRDKKQKCLEYIRDILMEGK